jgi:hypothetical protein
MLAGQLTDSPVLARAVGQRPPDDERDLSCIRLRLSEQCLLVPHPSKERTRLTFVRAMHMLAKLEKYTCRWLNTSKKSVA